MTQMTQMARTWVGAVALGLAVAPIAAAQTRPVSVDDILDLKTVSSPVVSPDGSRVLYTVRGWEIPEKEPDQRESRTRIWMVPVGGGPARQIAFGERGDSQPQWSPDGRFISFLSARGVGTGEDAPRPQIYLMPSDGGEAWKLTDAKDGVTGYTWSPDSRRIAYVTVDPRPSSQEADIRKQDDERVFEKDFRYTHIWTIEIDPSTGSGSPRAESRSEAKPATRVTEGTSWSVRGTPSWASDSKRIVFAAGVTTML